MAKNITIPMIYRVDFDQPIGVTSLRTPLVMQDKAAHKLIIDAHRSGTNLDLSSCGVTAYMIRADKTTLTITGTIDSQGRATATLPSAAYAIPGQAQIVVNVTTTDTITTALVLDCVILRSTTDTYIDPGHVVPDITELLAQIATMRSATTEATNAAVAAREAAETYRMSWAYDADGDVVVTVP